jgi:hypothetical protein
LRELAENGKIYFQDAKHRRWSPKIVDLQPERKFSRRLLRTREQVFFGKLSGRRAARKLFVGGDLYERLKTARKTCERVGAKNYQLRSYDAEKSLPFADESFDAFCSTRRVRARERFGTTRKFVIFCEERFRGIIRQTTFHLEKRIKSAKVGRTFDLFHLFARKRRKRNGLRAFSGGKRRFQKSSNPICRKDFITADGYARTFPARDRMDGFFIAVFSKR